MRSDRRHVSGRKIKLNAVDPQAYLINSLDALVNGHKQSRVMSCCHGIICPHIAIPAGKRSRPEADQVMIDDGLLNRRQLSIDQFARYSSVDTTRP
jgi:hypothetical protein